TMQLVIRTIVMSTLFARRQRTSTSAYFTNSLTPPARLGLLASPCGSTLLRSGSAWLGRSQKDGLPGLPRGSIVRSRPSTRAQERGQPGRCPFLSGSGNGRQVAGGTNETPRVHHAARRRRRMAAGGARAAARADAAHRRADALPRE